MDKDYSKREIDEFFKDIGKRFDNQDKKLESIDSKVSYTNGKVATAIIDIEKNKSSVNQNWRAIQVATAIFITVIIPLIAIIYSNIQSSISDVGKQIQVIQQKK